MIDADMDKKKNVTFSNNSSLDIDKIITFLCEIYGVPKPRWTMGDLTIFQVPDLIMFPERYECESDDSWLYLVFHEFGHYLHYCLTTTHFRDMLYKDISWNKLKKFLIDEHIMCPPIFEADEAFAEVFAATLRDLFKQLKPEYKKMFGLKVEY